MHKNNMSFDTLNPKTPLSARWAQMSKQEQIIETKRLEILAKMEAQKKAKQKPSEASKSESLAMNKFSNDGSFLNQFKKLADTKQGKKPEPAAVQPPEEDRKRSVDEDKSRGRRDERQSSFGARHSDSRERSRSPTRGSDRRRNIYKWDSRDRPDSREGKNRRWDSGGQHSRPSPSPPLAREEPLSRRPPCPPPPPPFYPMQGNPPPIMMPPMFQNQFQQNPKFPGYNFPPSNALMQQMITPPPTNDFHMKNFSTPPPFRQMPPQGPNQNHMNNPLNMQPKFEAGNTCSYPPPINPSNMPPVNNFKQRSCDPTAPLGDSPLPGVHPPLSMPPGFPPMFSNIRPPVGVPKISSNMGMNMNMSPVPTFIPPPMSVPLHTIPEPKPLDAISIPPPKPLEAMKIPPPAPLEAVKIPPPKPMNLRTIPPPSPICLTLIPKPKELDVCSIPPPPASTVLSADERGRSSLEAVASEVARAGDDLEDLLKAQCQHDPSVWFLQDETSADYKGYRELVSKYRREIYNLHEIVKNESKYNPEDCSDFFPSPKKCVAQEEKYEPEFSLDYESSDEDSKPTIKNEVKSENECAGDFYKLKAKNAMFSSKVKSEGSGSDSDGQDEGKMEKMKRRERKRKSRWGDGPSAVGLPGVATVTNLGGAVQASPLPTTVPLLPVPGVAAVMAGGMGMGMMGREKPQLSKITRQEPGLLQYALSSYGSVNLSEEDWKKCEEHYKISLLYQEMLKKRRELEQLAARGHHKYEYDSDEEVEGGTWEHRLRMQEMEATSRWAGELTRAASGKHHIGDFLPPDELKRFMDKYSAVKGGQEPDLSDYKEYKLKEDNIGFKMLQKLGWTEGEGLGADGSGIVNPVNKGGNRESNQGLGIDRGDNLEEGDDEFDAYRKRMMLAYRFRPNPLNNPRRPYY